MTTLLLSGLYVVTVLLAFYAGRLVELREKAVRTGRPIVGGLRAVKQEILPRVATEEEAEEIAGGGFKIRGRVPWLARRAQLERDAALTPEQRLNKLKEEFGSTEAPASKEG